MTSRELFERNISAPSDIGGHMEVMREFGKGCSHITEFGVRGGNSTSCWLDAKPAIIKAYDWAVPSDLPLFEQVANRNGTDFTFTQADTSRIEKIDATDLLFLDTLHTYGQVKAELIHADKVSKYLIFHDTETNRLVGEGGQLGIWPAIEELLASNKPVWKMVHHEKGCNGLTILERS